MAEPDNRPPLDWDNFPKSRTKKKQRKERPHYPLMTPCLGTGLLVGMTLGLVLHNLFFYLGLGMMLGLTAGWLLRAK